MSSRVRPTFPLRNAGLGISLLASLVLAACHGDTAEPTSPTSTASNNSPTATTTKLPGGTTATGVIHFASVVGVDSTTGASISTDKDDYLPGDSVRIVGAGWTAGETVHFSLTREPDVAAVGVVSWDAVADEQGNLATAFEVVATDFGTTFTMTATGATSGSSVTTSFTDGTFQFAILTSPSGLVASIGYIVRNACDQSNGAVTGTYTGTRIAVNGNKVLVFRIPAVSGYTYQSVAGPLGVTISTLPNDSLCVTGGSPTGADQNKDVTLTYQLDGPPPVADLTISKSHSGNFTAGGTGSYTIIATNSGTGSTSGTVTVTDNLPSGLTATALSGTGWTCTLATLTCTRSDALAAGASYAAITVSVNVALNAPASVTNSASVSGGGETDTGNDTATDATTVIQLPDLTVDKSHTGNFTFGTNGSYAIKVSNGGNGPKAAGTTVTVTDALPALLGFVSAAGTGWTCSYDGGTKTATCTRSDALAASASYPDITLTVSPQGAGSATNTASVAGGSETNTGNNSDADATTIDPAQTSTDLTVTPSSQQYSDKTVLKATVTPFQLPAGTPTQQLTGTVYFYVGAGAQACGTSAPAGSVGSDAIADADDGVAEFTYTIDRQPGTYAVTACFYSSNTSFTSSNDDASLGVTQEDASVIDFASSPAQVLVGSPATITFKVRETNPELNSDLALVAAGNIDNATVALSLKGVLNGGTTIVSCTPSNNGLSGYDRVRSFSCTTSTSLAADTYEAEVTVGGYYTGGNSIVIQITDPSAGFATGGGWYWFGGDRVNFGFMAKATVVNSKKVNYQGALLVIRHRPDGTVIKVKSNMFEGYSVQGTEITFSGKANYFINGVTDGNYAFTGYGNDLGTSGGGVDKFGLYYTRPGNLVATSSTVTGLPTTAVTLEGGNIQVPQPGRK